MSSIPRLNMLLYGLPVFSVDLKSLEERLVFEVCPPSRILPLENLLILLLSYLCFGGVIVLSFVLTLITSRIFSQSLFDNGLS